MSPASADPPGLSRSLLSVKPFPWLRPRFIVFPKKKLLDPFKDLVAEGHRATSDQTMRANFDQVLDPWGSTKLPLTAMSSPPGNPTRRTPEQQALLAQTDKDMVSAPGLF